jgi:MFS family permease
MGCVIACAAAALPFTTTGLLPVAALFMLGIPCGSIAMVSFASASEIAGSSGRASLALSVVIFGQYAGMSTGPLLFSTITASKGWAAAALFLAFAAFLACLCAFLVKIK